MKFVDMKRMLLLPGFLGMTALSTGSHALAVEVDDGTESPARNVLATRSVGVLIDSSPNPGFTQRPSVVNTLGSFNIVIRPGSALAANTPALDAFNRAAAQWESFIADPITVTIDADLASLDPGVLGSAGSVRLFDSYDIVRNSLVLDSADETDDAIVAALPTAAEADFTVPDGFAVGSNLSANKANFKALGFEGLDEQFGVSDGTITFSSNFSFDFDNSDGVGMGQFDFEGVAIHEIGHVLGFVSEVDSVDGLLNANMTSANLIPTTLDLFRFADDTMNDPDNLLDFTMASRSLVPGSDDIFDQVLPGFGNTESLLSTGAFTGDGNQASHFKDNLALGILDPTFAPGEIGVISPNDLRAFDLIGYEISVVAVPEPGTLLALIAGGLFAVCRRRRSEAFTTR